MSKVRTRFAPSPTGRMHVGNLRSIDTFDIVEFLRLATSFDIRFILLFVYICLITTSVELAAT